MEKDAQFLTNDLLEDRPDRGAGEVSEPGEYQFHMRKEAPWKQSEIETDPENGRRFQYWDVGMTRNAKPENRKRSKVWLDPTPHVILDQNVPLRGWYKNKHEPANVRARPCYTDAILTQPYGGFCMVGCAFCYINHGYRGYRGTGLATVDPSYPDKCRKQVSTMRRATAFYLSSFTDPFQPLEDIYHNSQRTAQVAVDNRLPIFFLTRRIVPGWAYDMLAKNPYSYMQFSINTPRPEVWKRLSPNAIPLVDMFRQVEEIHRRGIYCSIQVNPIIAGVSSVDEIVELIYVLASKGADHLIFKFVEISPPSKQAMIDQMRRRFPREETRDGTSLDPAGEFEKLFTDYIGGEITIREDYRLSALDRFKHHCRKAGVTMATCYEYRYERNAAGEITSKTGVSVGGDYLTADQCHGHRVPIYTRISSDDPWAEIEACPPSGCLTCSDQFGGDGAVPCNNPELARAPAWRPAQMKNPAQLPILQ